MPEVNQQSLTKVLNSPAPKNLEEFNIFISHILEWTLSRSVFENKTPLDKLKLFFYVLEKNPEYSQKIQIAFSNYGKEIDFFHVFASSGINLHSSLANEFFDRLFSMFSLFHREDTNLHHHFEHIISEEDQINWLLQIDPATSLKLQNFIGNLLPNELFIQVWNEALSYLISQLSAEGLDPKLHKRYFNEKINQSVFFQLNGKWSALLKAEASQQTDISENIKKEFLLLLNDCRTKIELAPELFQSKGVDSDLVFKLEKLNSLEQRIRSLTKLKYKELTSEESYQFCFQLLKSYVDHNNLFTFYHSTFTVLAKQIITMNASKASHYIAKNRAHFISLFKEALGGGALTAATVIIKFLIANTGLTGFWLGFFNMLNYAISFLLIHYLHFTLATKQPANTASQIANLITIKNDPQVFNQLISEIKSVLKSQFTSVLGNLVAVIPMSLLFAYAFLAFTDHHFLDISQAQYTLESLKLVSLVPVYAIFTGFILWTAGLFGGWINNFIIFFDLDKMLSATIKTKASTLFSALGSNIYLGFSLGMLPEILKFLKLPLDVRHITLSTGTLFIALPVLGFQNVSWLTYFNIFLGLFVIAFFNIFTSFFLTIKLSFKASAISKERQVLIYRKLLKSLLTKG